MRSVISVPDVRAPAQAPRPEPVGTATRLESGAPVVEDRWTGHDGDGERQTRCFGTRAGRRAADVGGPLADAGSAPRSPPDPAPPCASAISPRRPSGWMSPVGWPRSTRCSGGTRRCSGWSSTAAAADPVEPRVVRHADRRAARPSAAAAEAAGRPGPAPRPVLPADLPWPWPPPSFSRCVPGCTVDAVVVTAPDGELGVAPLAAVFEQFAQQALRDPLDGSAEPAVPAAAARAVADAGVGVLCAIGLDRFSDINDHLGHAAGDHVLVEFSLRLRVGGPRRRPRRPARVAT